MHKLTAESETYFTVDYRTRSGHRFFGSFRHPSADSALRAIPSSTDGDRVISALLCEHKITKVEIPDADAENQ